MLSRTRVRLFFIALVVVASLVAAALVMARDNQPPQATGLTVAPAAPMAGYDRARFGGWGDTDLDGCDTRAEVLIRDLAGETVEPGCKVVEGYYDDPYTGMHGRTPARNLDVDHVVALADAWRSGAHSWSMSRRYHFANDERNLLAVAAYVNRAKADAGPDEWHPPWPGGRCTYARTYAATKAHWGLTVTPTQHRALGTQLADCDRKGVPNE